MADQTPTANPEELAPPDVGGSSAARAYREELARQGNPPDQAAAPVASALPKVPGPEPVPEARVAQRKKINGRARAVASNGKSMAGKMIDMSLTGACVLMEDMFPSRLNCVLEFDIFHDGRRYVFSTPAVSVYGVLASGKGFKVGFQFGASGQAASKSIADLVR